ncbi:MAG: SUMF1/EgtB/PvdO family nonheme iron enzyme [Burkholderiaceae bacterium]|jgi:gamma-glutamyl hercynylcysteine S-oxide synthase|nr:SUMF1/EgtB/PvdO family nonheme iron enzyme [Burkholderiaceae bacterium]MDP4969443.1 SUMF1/EgtB/PvdO family nonheme iron enzyme [Burkholderiaceae bacterium]
MRQAEVNILAQGLKTLRSHTLEAYAHYQRAAALTVPLEQEFNPPLWELGHLAWFQEYWVARNQQRDRGILQDIKHPRLPSIVPMADTWYDSAHVAHDLRWSLPLLQTEPCLNYLQHTLAETLAHLACETDDSPSLYFYWLALQHEAMHLEASTYMAQALGIPFEVSWAPDAPRYGDGFNNLPSIEWSMGADWNMLGDKSFCFDNEVGLRKTHLERFSIALHPVTWGEYLRFIEATRHRLPPYVRPSTVTADALPFEINTFGTWHPIHSQSCATHISWDDAQAYCRWAQCRLPTEAEWDYAARTQTDFSWGEVWEWTADTFSPFDGFSPHPYAEYSEPWFGTRKVLRGAAHATHPYLRNVHYRNFFTPERRDIYAGFRVCRT